MGVPSSRRKKRGAWGDGYNTDEVVQLYPGARLALRELAMNPKYRNVKIAVASTSLEPEYSRSCIAGIEIVEGVTMKDMISYAQIGRSGKLTSIKTSHFQLIHGQSGIPYEDMLFFDDCNWDDHVGCLERNFGVVGMRTPNGLRLDEFHQGLLEFSIEKRKRDGTLNQS
jgi:magnesium-dependent phosphatase 1